MDNNLQSDTIPCRWTDGKIMDINVINCCAIPGPEGAAFGKLADGTRVKLTTIGFSEKGIQVFVQKRTGHPSPKKRKSKKSTSAVAAKKSKNNNTSEDVSPS
jgi:hypothetical protein